MEGEETDRSGGGGRARGERASERGTEAEVTRGRAARPTAVVRRVDRALARDEGGGGGGDRVPARVAHGRASVGLSAEAREAAYRLARERIFGDGGDDDAGEGRSDDRTMRAGVGSGAVGVESSAGGGSVGRMSAAAEPFAPSKAVKKGSWRDRTDPEEYRRGTRDVGTGVFLPRSQQYGAPPFVSPPFTPPPFVPPPFGAPPFGAPPFGAPPFAPPPFAPQQYRASPPLVATAPPVPKGPPPPNQLIRPPSR